MRESLKKQEKWCLLNDFKTKNNTAMRRQKIFLSLVLFLFAANVFAQSGWQWQNPLPTGNDLYKVKFIDVNTGFAVGENSTIIKTTHGGINWTYNKIEKSGVRLMHICAIDQNTIYIFSSGKDAFKTTNGGNNWISQQILFTGDFYDIMFSNINTGWAAGQFGTINSTINGGVGVKLISSEIPESFALHQNFPNPFNPVTKINYELPASRGERVTNYVSLTVFDILGNEIKSLVNAKQTAGSYEVDFDGKGLSSGIYFYKLSAGSFSETKMMTLIK